MTETFYRVVKVLARQKEREEGKRAGAESHL